MSKSHGCCFRPVSFQITRRDRWLLLVVCNDLPGLSEHDILSSLASLCQAHQGKRSNIRSAASYMLFPTGLQMHEPVPDHAHCNPPLHARPARALPGEGSALLSLIFCTLLLLQVRYKGVYCLPNGDGGLGVRLWLGYYGLFLRL